MTATLCDIVVDDELRSLIPPLADEEQAALEANVLRDGCLDPLIIWREQQVLLDGHHRKAICDRFGVDYQTRQLSLPDRDAAKRWVIEHQFGRRNLTPYQRAELALKLKPLLVEEAKQRQKEAGSYGSEGGRGNRKTLPRKSWEGNVDKQEQEEIARIRADFADDHDVQRNLIGHAQQRYAKERRRLRRRLRLVVRHPAERSRPSGHRHRRLLDRGQVGRTALSLPRSGATRELVQLELRVRACRACPGSHLDGDRC